MQEVCACILYTHEESVDEECNDDGDSNDDDMRDDGIIFEDIKPALEKFKQAVENVEELSGKHSLECKKCKFEAKDLNGLIMHIKTTYKN